MYKESCGDVKVRLCNEDAMKLLLEDKAVLKSYVKGGRRLDWYVRESASHLYSFTGMFRKNPNLFIVHRYVPSNTLVAIGRYLGDYYSRVGDYKRSRISYNYMRWADKMFSSGCYNYSVASDIVSSLNNCNISTHVYVSKGTGSVYIKPDNGLIKTIRVSDHRSHSSKFRHKYSVLCNFTYKGASKAYEYEGDSIEYFINSTTRNTAIKLLVKDIEEEVAYKKNKLGMSGYNRSKFKNYCNPNYFSKVRKLTEYKYL